ncbi:MAG TPA: thermonuclease family protein [Alphaproteobacteria bacterium]|nr:thermonuclease family protein [Alphaproteobacteria bacterium]
MRRLVASLLVLLLGAAPAAATATFDRLPGPYPAEVLSVVDGDTLKVRVAIWLGQTVETHVRLDGLDTPELRGKCETERDAAKAAREALGALIGPGPVLLADVRADKYGGRVIARVTAADGHDIAALLIAKGHGRAYGGAARGGWCG